VPEQKHKTKTTSEKEAPAEVKPKDLKAKGKEIKEELTDLSDAIDDILQENAEEFVTNYVQRGGE